MLVSAGIVTGKSLWGLLSECALDKAFSEAKKQWLDPIISDQRKKDAYERALDRSIEGFCSKHSELAASLLDETFIKNFAAPHLLKIRIGQNPEINSIVLAYKASFNHVEIQDEKVRDAVNDLINMLHSEMCAEDELHSEAIIYKLNHLSREINNVHKAIDESVSKDKSIAVIHHAADEDISSWLYDQINLLSFNSYTIQIPENTPEFDLDCFIDTRKVSYSKAVILFSPELITTYFSDSAGKIIFDKWFVKNKPPLYIVSVIVEPCENAAHPPPENSLDFTDLLYEGNGDSVLRELATALNPQASLRHSLPPPKPRHTRRKDKIKEQKYMFVGEPL